MNGRAMYREYTKSKGKDCYSFISMDSNWNYCHTLNYLDSKGIQHEWDFDHSDMVMWMIRKCEVTLK